MSGGPEDIAGVYERQAAAWDQFRLREGVEGPWLERFAALLASDAHVLDLGCGGGEPIAAWLVARGFEVTGVDQSSAMLSLLRERLPQVTAIQADMRTLSLHQAFDGVVMWDSFFHLTPDAQRQTLSRVCDHLRPGGALLFTCGPEAGERVGTVGTEHVYHASLDPSEYVAILAEHELQLRGFIAEDPKAHGHTVMLAQKA
ncbi:MAG: class I SAM-dependent methyltransferase [Pseudomonadota bacterium]